MRDGRPKVLVTQAISEHSLLLDHEVKASQIQRIKQKGS